MAIDMKQVRRLALAAFGRTQDTYDSLPMDFGTHPSHLVMPELSLRGAPLWVKVLTATEAKQVCKTGAKRPHRILAWCRFCKHWKFAGKIVQHQKTCSKKEEVL